MIRDFKVLLLLLLVFSCATNDKNKEEDVNELDSLSNDVFIVPNAKNFSPEDDFLEEDLGSEANVLFTESIAKVEPDEISSIESISHPLTRALVACYKGEYAISDRLFDENLKVYRKNPIYWTQIANCFLRKGNKRKALLYYNKAKEFRSRYAPPVNNIGVILERQGFPQKSLKAYEEAMDIASFSLTPMFNTAALYTRYGLASEAKELLVAIRKLNSDDFDATNSLAYLELIKGNYKKSVAYYSKISSKHYRKPEVGANLALSLHMMGKKDKAKKIIKKLDKTSDPALTEYILQIKKLL
jgi:tetratricopeptide (TPR) repeat protein